MNTNSPSITYYNVVTSYQPNTRPDELFRNEYVRNNLEPIIDVPEDYMVSINQMRLPVNHLPIFIAKEKYTTNPNNGNPFWYNDLVYNITMKYDNASITLPVIYESAFTSTNIWIPEYVNPRYYWVYNYTDFLEMINKTILNVLDQLKLLKPAIATANAPFFYFDATSGLISLYAEEDYFEESVPPIIELFVNNELNRFFQAFTVNVLPNVSSNEFLQFRIFNKNNLNRVVIGGVNYIKMTQDFNALVLWNDIETIQFTTNLPISSEYVEQKGTNSNTTDNILRDFIIFYPSTNSTSRTNINYAIPEYNLTNLYGTTPIRNIIITGYWVSKSGVRYPLFLQEGETSLIKLMFRKKSTLRITK